MSNLVRVAEGWQARAEREHNLLATKNLLNRLIILPLELESAETVGRIYAELETKGQTIGLWDALIGAITLTKGYTIITRNVEYFQKIPGLTVITAP